MSVVMGCGAPCCNATNAGWNPAALRTPPVPSAPRTRMEPPPPLPQPDHTPDYVTKFEQMLKEYIPLKVVTDMSQYARIMKQKIITRYIILIT